MSQQSDIRIFHLLHRVHQATFRASDKLLGDALGISTTQSAVLMFLKQRKGVSMGTLAAGIGLKITSLSGLIDRMEHKGLVARQRSAKDRRSVEIVLTPMGRCMLAKAEPLVRTANDAVLKEIGSTAEARAFASACESIIDLADDLYTDKAATAVTHKTQSKSATS